MAADIGALFNAGPKVVEGATFEEGLDFQDLGGPMVHCTNGTIDNLAANEAECFEQIRTVLSYLPNSGSEAPPVVPGDDPVDREDIALRSIIPRRQARMYNPRTIITSVVDRDSWFEIGALWGRTAIGGLARLGGHPVGVVSLNCEVNGGALDAAGSQKLTRLLKMCDVMNIPILQFLDVRKYTLPPMNLQIRFLTGSSGIRDRHSRRTNCNHALGRGTRQGVLHDDRPDFQCCDSTRLRRRRRRDARFPGSRHASCMAIGPMGLITSGRRD